MKYRVDAKVVKGMLKKYNDGVLSDMKECDVNVQYQKAWDSEVITLSVGDMSITVPADEVLEIIKK